MEREGISLDVVFCIMQNTKYYALKATEYYTEGQAPMDKMELELNDSPENASTLCGCKSVAWSTFYEYGMEHAISFARSAIHDNPNCSTWHFILGKNLRRYRRLYIPLSSMPSSEEIESFSKSYDLSLNPLYGIYLAQAHYENTDCETSKKIYMKVHEAKPKNIKIQLRLALCFLRIKDLNAAKGCLDYVEKFDSECKMLWHYKGIYYIKCNNFEVIIQLIY